MSPRKQWGDSGGYCGSLSIQAIALSHGVWISQDQVRKAAGPGGGHGDKMNGYEILHTNIGGALDTLKLDHNDWDFNKPEPQYKGYLLWLKQQLARGWGVVWMILCKGDGHDTYGIAKYDHVEPVFGIYSNDSLSGNITSYNDDDIIRHGSDYSPDGNQNAGYFRRMDSLMDTVLMDGNCKDARPGVGNNEPYPCVPFGKDYGFAITGQSGYDGPLLSLSVDSFEEPDIKRGAKPAALHGVVSVSGLSKGAAHTLYRFADATSIPASTSGYEKAALSAHKFTATLSDYVYHDPMTILSSGTAYYRVV